MTPWNEDDPYRVPVNPTADKTFCCLLAFACLALLVCLMIEFARWLG